MQKRKSAETELTRREKELTETQNRQKTLVNWFDKNKKHEPMCGNMNLIVGFLDSAAEALEQKRQKEILLKELIQREAQLLPKLDILRKQQITRNENLDKIQKEKQNLQTQVNAIDILLIKRSRKELQTRKDHLKETQNRLKEILALQDTIGQKEKQLQDQLQIRDNFKQQKELIEKKWQKATIQRDTSRQIYEKAQLWANADMTALRQQLIPGTPCPVCGSCQHPAVGHSTPDKPTTDLLKIEYEKYEDACNELQNETVRLTQDLLHTGQLLLSLEKEIQSYRKQCEGRIQNWSRQNSPDFTPQTLDPATTGQLAKELTEVEENLNKLDHQETVYEQYTTHLNELTNRIEKEQRTRQQIEEQIVKAKEETDKISAEILKEKALGSNLKLQADRALDKLDGKITIGDWRTRWESDSTRFRQELTDAAEKWEAKRQEQEKLRTAAIQQQAGLKEAKHTLERMLDEEKEASALLDKRTETLNKLKAERNCLLEGKPVAEIEQIHRQRIKKQTETKELLASQKQTAEIRLQQLIGEAKQLTENIGNLKKQHAEKRRQLAEWLERYNSTTSASLTEENLIELLTIEPEEINGMKQTAEHIQREYTIAETTLNEREKQLRQHLTHANKPENTEQIDTLEKKNNLLKQQLEALQHEQTEISVELRNHKQNCLQAGKLKQVLEQQTEIMDEWSKLDDLIGSQSGNKFKEIAQGYTLDILLSYANKQLKELTPRYQLQRVPGELAFQIVDHDMCDEIRSVFSLSGGESFLVSLALALGLSSFSSNNHHEENLFIDEGFGTLDTDTLQVVMEALERLRSQGRKVGVISHVQEMAERIPVQIYVHKAGNGKSKVKITS